MHYLDCADVEKYLCFHISLLCWRISAEQTDLRERVLGGRAGMRLN